MDSYTDIVINPTMQVRDGVSDVVVIFLTLALCVLCIPVRDLNEGAISIDHLLYIGSQEKLIQEKTGLVWAFSFSEKPLQALCRGFYP